MFYLGLVTYLLNVGVGLAAQLGGVRFGVWHHVLYAVVFAAAIAATFATRYPAMFVTLVALAVFPKARPRTPWHPLLAAVGFAGYLWTLAATR